jgi:hypothetical protein
MSYTVPTQDVAGFFQNGFVILRQILPATLVSDLRRECNKAVAVERAKSGPQVQRFQPISKYADAIDSKAFRDYAELPALHEAFREILGPQVFYGLLDVMGVFVEPAEKPWSVLWHRDMTRQSSRLETDEEYAAFALDWDSLNQINCALYDDSCTWYVPGSHARIFDLPEEVAVARGAVNLVEDPDTTITERNLLNFVRSMPGATQVHLHAGDLLLYRAIGWHCGNYVPYRKRATILDVLYSPAYYEWRHLWLRGESPKWKGATTVANQSVAST